MTPPLADVRPLVVVALGGNALLPPTGALTMAAQREQAWRAAAAIAPLAQGHRLVVTHGSGPQVGILASQAAHSDALTDMSLDVIDAEIEGMLGYVLMQAFAAEIEDEVVTILTQVLVHEDDEAFSAPSKPIGPVVDEPTARKLTDAHSWSFVQRSNGWRRVVASPTPTSIVELPAIRALVAAGIVPICAGGGGIPVVVDGERLRGIEAVVDKDLATSLLARELHADALLLLTDVAGLMSNWGTPECNLVRHAPIGWASRLPLESGSMAPKVAACTAFTGATGNPSFIGRLSDAPRILLGFTGTRFELDELPVAAS